MSVLYGKKFDAISRIDFRSVFGNMIQFCLMPSYSGKGKQCLYI